MLSSRAPARESPAAFERQLKTLEKALHPGLVPTGDIQRLLRIPGIGKTKAFTTYLETGDINRFPSEKQFFSYCRLVHAANGSPSVSKPVLDV